ncbi:hypothetical protein FUAX_27100 [Fulvitalea axinellae]|uniref:3-hydroxybutyryl-CoA dehydrogenase n=1 Tax=Fulvitalea axinellae TaxID=1182444 RepID=A0AAU9CQB9_9BACT|nr:hypothetical protein FUAX_27100 [Fulvitalea axinellae]
MKIEDIKTVGIVGADPIGQGIAAMSAMSGYETYLYDINNQALDPAYESIRAELNRQISAGKITEAEGEAAMGRLHITYDIRDITGEVVIENLNADKKTKKMLVEELERLNAHTSIIVTNTGDVSVTQLAGDMSHPGRFAGIHLFNPVPKIPLVEVIAGEATDPSTVELISEYTLKMGKTPVKVKDTPGFVVNRVASPFYLESLKVLEEGVADVKTIDALLENAGFTMGPFKVIDYLGVDTNQKISQMMFKAFGNEPRFRPSRIQQRKVDVGHLGQKSGKGFYDYEKNK